MLAGDFGDGGLVHVLVEAGHEVVVGHTPDGLAGDFAFLYLGRKLDAELYHGLEEQVLVGAVVLDVVLEEQVLVELFGRVIHIQRVPAHPPSPAMDGISTTIRFRGTPNVGQMRIGFS